MEQNNYQKVICVGLSILCLFAIVTAFKILSSVFIPLTVAILLALVYYPICKNLHRRLHIPWVLCVIILLVLTIAALYIVSQLLIASVSMIIESYPKYESRFTSIYLTICETFHIEYNYENSLLTNIWSSLNVRSAIQKAALTFSSSLVTFGKTLLLVGLFVAFLLVEMSTLKVKMEQIFEEQKQQKKIKLMALKTVTEVTHYISIKFFISLITGVLVGLSTFVIKMDFPIVWGFTAFILNFIPSFGSIISWGMTTLFAVIQFYPNWGYVIYVGFMVLAINMILGNIVEPRWEGTDLGISPFMIIVSLSFFGWLWGFVGMIIAVPLMVIIKIVCENTTALHSLAVLMGNGNIKKKSD